MFADETAPDPRTRVWCPTCNFHGTRAQTLQFVEGRPLCVFCRSEVEVAEVESDEPVVVRVPASEAFACLLR